MKPLTIQTLRGHVEDLKLDAFVYGRYEGGMGKNWFENRDRGAAFQCIKYVRTVRAINALEDALLELEGKI